MKGATDGGLHVPHSVKRFPGFQKGEKKTDAKYDAAVHRDRIFGVHVDSYME
jgi:large subunit ribosomal protein L5e